MTFDMKLVEPPCSLKVSADTESVDDLVSLSIEGSQVLEAAGYAFWVGGFGHCTRRFVQCLAVRRGLRHRPDCKWRTSEGIGSC